MKTALQITTHPFDEHQETITRILTSIKGIAGQNSLIEKKNEQEHSSRDGKIDHCSKATNLGVYGAGTVDKLKSFFNDCIGNK